MGTVNINLAEAQNLNLPLGLQLENEVTEVVFDFSAWQTAYGSGDLGLSIQRPGDSQPYAGELTIDGTDATWTVSSLDIAYKGVGEIQLTYTVGTVVKKSVIYKFTVYKSLGANGEYPSPGQTWQEGIEDDIEGLRTDVDADHDELIDIREGADGVTYPSAGDAVRGQITDLKQDLKAKALCDNQVIYNTNKTTVNGSSNWPTRRVDGNISYWNGTFGTGASNYYQDLLFFENYASTLNGITSTFYDFTSLQAGHIYKVNSYVLDGSITVGNGVANIVVKDIMTIPIGGSGTFEFNGNMPKFYLHFTKGVTLSNAVIAVIVEDITETFDLKNSILNGAIKKKLSGYTWVRGKYTTREASISTPDSATNTIALTNPIPYDYNIYFILKSGWKVSFASVENNIISGTAKAYISTAGRINMIDVYNNLTYLSTHYFGDSFVINIRKSDDSNITLADVNIDDVLEMYVVTKNGDADGSKTWVAIGDSITDGRYTQSDGTVRSKTNHYCQYGYIASRILGIDNYIEQGYGGMGYVHVANDGTYLTDVLAMDLGDPDIITVNLGVNDRSQSLGDENSTANDGTISGAIRNCCEVLGENYPNAHIIFMTPINAYATGSVSTGWCKRSGTTHLEDIAEMIKYWAGLYGFPVIDMLNTCPINDFNIQTMILDELHPTMEAHCMLGKYLAGALPYKVI